VNLNTAQAWEPETKNKGIVRAGNQQIKIHHKDEANCYLHSTRDTRPDLTATEAEQIDSPNQSKAEEKMSLAAL
jgi:hypothetical protein